MSVIVMDVGNIGLDNRKLAALIWIVLLMIAMITQKSFRNSLKQLTCSFVHPTILLIFLSSSLYSVIFILVLSKIGYWHVQMFADTVIWIFGTSFSLLLSSPQLKEAGQFQTKMWEYFSATILLDFAVNLYPMRLLFELVFLPVMTLLFGMVAVSQHDPKLHPIKQLTEGIISIVGFFILLYSIVAILGNINHLAIIPFAESLLLMPLLTFFYIPFLYITTLITAYESFFSRARRYKSAKAFARPTFWTVFKQCHISLSKLDMYSKNFFQEYLKSVI